MAANQYREEVDIWVHAPGMNHPQLSPNRNVSRSRRCENWKDLTAKEAMAFRLMESGCENEFVLATQEKNKIVTRIGNSPRIACGSRAR